jgi:hypothetical protein
MTPEPLKWQLIDPTDAVGLDLRSTPSVRGPMNERGQVCPWPWEFEQLEFDPTTLHTCTRCGQRGTAGLEHPDFRDVLTDLS